MSTFHTSLISGVTLTDIEPAHRAACKTVLWSLGNHVPENTGNPTIRPGLELLARETGLGEQDVHEAVELLAAEDWVRVQRHDDRDKDDNDSYWVNVAKLASAGVAVRSTRPVVA